MGLQVHIPASPLSTFVEGMIYFEGLEPVHGMDRFLPDGNTELLFDLSENPQFIFDNETLEKVQACRYAWISGVRTWPITIPSGRGVRMLIVAFRKGGAWPFYPLPMSEITDRVVDADLILGGRIHELREQLLACASPRQMFGLVERFLLSRAAGLLEADIVDSCVEFAVSRLVCHPNRLSLQRLREQIGYSQKHIIALFKSRVGVTPKQYMRIMRFQNTILEIEACESIGWSRIAQQSGYYDQAHLIHDFRRFAGLTSGEYILKKSGVLNYVPVG